MMKTTQKQTLKKMEKTLADMSLSLSDYEKEWQKKLDESFPTFNEQRDIEDYIRLTGNAVHYISSAHTQLEALCDLLEI